MGTQDTGRSQAEPEKKLKRSATQTKKNRGYVSL